MAETKTVNEILAELSNGKRRNDNNHKKHVENRLTLLKEFDFPKAAYQYAAKNYKVFDADTLSPSLTDGFKDFPLAYSLSKEIRQRNIIYAARGIQRLFITQEGAAKFEEMDFQRFSVFASQVCRKNEELDALVSEKVKGAIFYRLLSDPTLQISPDLFECQERYINVANGVVDLKTGDLLPHDAARFGFLNMLPYNYDKVYARSNKWPKLFQKMLKKTFPDKKDRKRFLQFVAYLISNDCSLKVALYMCGKPDTGKSTLMRLITLLVGEENVSNVPLAKFADRFALASTFGKKLNMAGETKTAPFTNLDNFKAAVGYDRIYAELKGQNPFFFIKKAKDFFLGNRLPVLSRECAEEAIYRRFELLELKNPVKRKKQRPQFEKTLMRKHGDKILCIAIREIREFYRNNLQFTESKASKALMGEFRKDAKPADSVHAFFKDCCKEKADSIESVRDICAAYEKYCQSNGYVPLSYPVFLRLLLKKGAFERCKMHPSRNLQYRAIKGIELNLA